MLDSLESLPTFLVEEEEGGPDGFSVDSSLDNFLTFPLCFCESDTWEEVLGVAEVLDAATFDSEVGLVGDSGRERRVGLVNSLEIRVGLVTPTDFVGLETAGEVVEELVNFVGLGISLARVGLVIDCAVGLVISLDIFVGLKTESLGDSNGAGFTLEFAEYPTEYERWFV